MNHVSDGSAGGDVKEVDAEGHFSKAIVRGDREGRGSVNNGSSIPSL